MSASDINLMAVAVGREDDNDTLVAYDSADKTYLDDDLTPVDDPRDAMVIATEVLNDDAREWERLARDSALPAWILGESHEDAYGRISFDMRPSTLADFRKHAGMTQVELAKRVGVSQSQIADWERRRNAPSAKSCVKLAFAFGVDAGAVLAAVTQVGE